MSSCRATNAKLSRTGWLHAVTRACGADNFSFIALMDQVEDLIDERGISGEDALRLLAGALS